MPAKQKPTKKQRIPELIKVDNTLTIQPATKKVFDMMDKGLNAEEATILVKGKDNLSPAAKVKINKKYARYSLTKPSIVKLAHNAVQDTLKMAEVIDSKGNVSIPSHTNRLAAASMVMDRVEPVVKVNHNLNINADVNPVDLSVYMSK